MLTQTDLGEIEKIVEETVEEKIGEKTNLLPTKNEFFGKMDEVMDELKAIREEHAISQAKLSEHSDQIENHENRILKLENSPVLNPQL